VTGNWKKWATGQRGLVSGTTRKEEQEKRQEEGRCRKDPGGIKEYSHANEASSMERPIRPVVQHGQVRNVGRS
jgi:hypothetical protein